MIRRLCFSYITVFIWLLWACVMVVPAGNALAGNETILDSNTGCQGDLPCLETEVQPSTAHVGETVRIIMKYRLPEGASLVDSDVIKGTEGLVVTGVKKTHGKVVVSCIVTSLDSWKSGPLALLYQEKSGAIREVSAPAISVKVGSGFGKDISKAQLQDINDIVPSIPILQRLKPYILIFALVLLLGVFLFFFYRWYKKRGLKKASQLSPSEEALNSLHSLEEKGFIQKGMFKHLYFELSEIIRRYIEAIREIPASEMTTDEIARKLKDPLDLELITLFREMDLVKFADSSPSENSVALLFERFERYINETSGENSGEISGGVQEENRRANLK